MAKIIFFDTETTGLPKEYKVNALAKQGNWPDIVSICWSIFENRRYIRTEHHIIRPENFTISAESTRIHGISQSKAETEGRPLKDILALFASDIKDANYMIAHNMHFDKNVLFNSYKWRLNMDPLTFWPSRSEFCTMMQSKDELKLPSKSLYANANDYKYPSLKELFMAQFGYDFKDAHTALGDVDALQRVVWARWDLFYDNGHEFVPRLYVR